MMIPADDRGFTLGDGLFETILFVDGAPRLWGEHFDRLARGCAVLGLPKPDIFVSDQLHMNEKGYKIWGPIIEPVLVKAKQPVKVIIKP